mgnify:CR=1 FL=1
MAITLTDRAANHVQNYLTRRGKGVGVRFGVRTTGCSGMAYKLEFVDAADDADHVFESHGVIVSDTSIEASIAIGTLIAMGRM